MKSPWEVARYLFILLFEVEPDDGDTDRRWLEAVSATIKARDAEHAADFEALEEHVACVYASEADLRMELAEAAGADALAAAPEGVSACRQHIDCVAADMAHMNAFGELASHGSLLDQARRAIDAAAPAVVPAETLPTMPSECTGPFSDAWACPVHRPATPPTPSAPPAPDMATVDCDGCGGPTRFIGQGLYECLTGCRWGEPCPHAIRFIDCRTCNRAAPTPSAPPREGMGPGDGRKPPGTPRGGR